jgi:hypothetical protein
MLSRFFASEDLPAIMPTFGAPGLRSASAVTPAARVAAPPVVAMRITWPGLGTSASAMRGTGACVALCAFPAACRGRVDPGLVEADRGRVTAS